MNPHVYNASLLIGIALVGAGVAMVSVPAALVAVGSLVIGLTLFGALMARK